MKKILVLAGLIGAITYSSSSFAGLYFGAGYGSSDVSLKSGGTKISPNKESGVFNAYVGYSIDLPIIPYIKAEFSYTRAEFEKTGVYDATSNTYMINGYMGIPQPIPFLKPYIGAGVGSTQIKNAGKSNSGTTYSGMIGLDVSIPLIPLKPGVEYKYTKATDIDLSGGKVDYTNSQVYFKLVYGF